MQIKKPLAEESFIIRSGQIDRVLRDRNFSGELSLRLKAHPDVLLLVKWTRCPTARELSIRFDYWFRSEPVGYVVRLDGQHCFGGKRLVFRFLCPRCEQASYKLFLPIHVIGKHFLCRSCWGIDYLSHIRPRKVSLVAVNRLSQNIQCIEAELVRLKRVHARLLLSTFGHGIDNGSNQNL